MKKYVQILCSTDVWYILIKKVDMNNCRGQISVKVLHLHLAVSLSHFILSCTLYCESTRNLTALEVVPTSIPSPLHLTEC